MLDRRPLLHATQRAGGCPGAFPASALKRHMPLLPIFTGHISLHRKTLLSAVSVSGGRRGNGRCFYTHEPGLPDSSMRGLRVCHLLSLAQPRRSTRPGMAFVHIPSSQLTCPFTVIQREPSVRWTRRPSSSVGHQVGKSLAPARVRMAALKGWRCRLTHWCANTFSPFSFQHVACCETE